MKFDRSNTLMKQTLRKIKKIKIKSNFDINYLLEILKSKIVMKHDCVLFEKTADMKGNFKNYGSRTEYEAIQNHLHISDLLNDNENSPVLLKIGLLIAQILYFKLKIFFPKRKFEILVTYDIKNEFGLNDCVVRFYQVRAKENYLPKNLNDFRYDAVGVIRVN